MDQLVQGKWPTQVLTEHEHNLRQLCASEKALMHSKTSTRLRVGVRGWGLGVREGHSWAKLDFKAAEGMMWNYRHRAAMIPACKTPSSCQRGGLCMLIDLACYGAVALWVDSSPKPFDK